jgi:hypothetical protein
MANGKQQYVYLVPQRSDENGVSWLWLYNGQSGPATNFPVIEATKNSGGHDIYFTIVDPENAIKFAGYDGPDTSKAIAIAEKNPTLPKPKSGIVTKGEIKDIDFGLKNTPLYGTQLFLDNANGKKVTLVYSLNFVDSSTNPHTSITSIDPEIKNNGGGGINQAVYYAIGAAIVGAVFAIVFARYAMGWRPR